MRILRLAISNWRNFRDVEFSVPSDSTLVCLVGENGTGKSNILELISAVAHRLGISPGVEINRGDPFNEPHSVSITLALSEPVDVLIGVGAWEALRSQSAEPLDWDGTLCLESSRSEEGRGETVTAGGKGDQAVRQQLANQIVGHLRKEEEIHYLYLDADRAYPPVTLQSRDYAAAIEQDWDLPELRRDRAFRPSRTLYEEWIRYMLAVESQEATAFFKKMRRFREGLASEPNFDAHDRHRPYKESVQGVLPHLHFRGVDDKKRTLIFDSADSELSFTSLSGGEREISFLVGQVERFGLRRGFLLVDEPELHLNPDLIRSWVAFLRDTVEEGQVWLATHSFEAVEVVGGDSTFVLQRSSTDRKVDRIDALADRPALSVLTSALGSPGFAVNRDRFVFVEGERDGDERERFQKLCPSDRRTHFMEGGGCREVAGKLGMVGRLASESAQPIRVGGIVDRDFRTTAQLHQLQQLGPVYALKCHEVENLFLHPDVIRKLLERQGDKTTDPNDVLRDAADRFAGGWIVERAVTRREELGPLPPGLRSNAWLASWASIAGDVAGFVCALARMAPDRAAQLERELKLAAQAYEAIRGTGALWKHCMGKQLLPVVSQRVGLLGGAVLERHALEVWDTGEAEPPTELTALRDYVAGL